MIVHKQPCSSARGVPWSADQLAGAGLPLLSPEAFNIAFDVLGGSRSIGEVTSSENPNEFDFETHRDAGLAVAI